MPISATNIAAHFIAAQHTPEVDSLTANDFDSVGKIKFKDGSKATFIGCVINEEKPRTDKPHKFHYLVVYTEHNGYHVFRRNSIKRFKSKKQQQMLET